MNRAKQRALEKYPPRKDGRTRSYICTDEDVRTIYAQGYRRAEKDIEALILKFLDSRNDRDYATVGWIKKNFGEYKKEIMDGK